MVVSQETKVGKLKVAEFELERLKKENHTLKQQLRLAEDQLAQHRFGQRAEQSKSNLIEEQMKVSDQELKNLMDRLFQVSMENQRLKEHNKLLEMEVSELVSCIDLLRSQLAKFWNANVPDPLQKYQDSLKI